MNKLMEFINKNYNLEIQSIQRTKRGFYGKTWILNTNDKAYFAKLDYNTWHKERFKNSLIAVDFLTSHNICFIPKIIKTTNNTLSCDFNGGILCITEYIKGRNTENYPIQNLFDKLIQIYKLGTPNIKIKKINFSTNNIEEYCKLKNNLIKNNVYDIQILKILDENEKLIDTISEKINIFSKKCKQENAKAKYVITHGDAGGNCIIKGNNLYLIDWDEVALAPIERDLWFFVHKQELLEIIQQVFLKNGYNFEFSWNRIAYFCYTSFFRYLNEYLYAYIFAENKNFYISKISQYFNSWIMEQLNFVNTLK